MCGFLKSEKWKNLVRWNPRTVPTNCHTPRGCRFAYFIASISTYLGHTATEKWNIRLGKCGALE